MELFLGAPNDCREVTECGSLPEVGSRLYSVETKTADQPDRLYENGHETKSATCLAKGVRR